MKGDLVVGHRELTCSAQTTPPGSLPPQGEGQQQHRGRAQREHPPTTGGHCLTGRSTKHATGQPSLVMTSRSSWGANGFLRQPVVDTTITEPAGRFLRGGTPTRQSNPCRSDHGKGTGPTQSWWDEMQQMQLCTGSSGTAPHGMKEGLDERSESLMAMLVQKMDWPA